MFGSKSRLNEKSSFVFWLINEFKDQWEEKNDIGW